MSRLVSSSRFCLDGYRLVHGPQLGRAQRYFKYRRQYWFDAQSLLGEARVRHDCDDGISMHSFLRA